MDFETRAIHAGQEPDPATGAIITPIYQTSTFVQEAVGVHKGYDYARVANPTRTALQVALASLENAKHGVAFSSGLGATTTLMHLVDPGERVVLIADVYGGVYRMTSQVYEPKGYRFTYVPASEFDDNLASHLDEDVKLVWVETPSNPTAEHRRHPQGRGGRARRRRAARRRQHVRDAVPAAAARARRRRRRALDDEVPRRPQRHDRRLRRHERRRAGRAALLPAEVARRGARPVRRLARPARDQDTGGSDAPALRERAADRRVPRRASRRSSASSIRACRTTRATTSRGARCATSAAWCRSCSSRKPRPSDFVARTTLFQLAESLGGVESLIEHPARMTHASTADAPFAPPGNLVRLSVGIESADDLLADLEAALVRRSAPARA